MKISTGITPQADALLQYLRTAMCETLVALGIPADVGFVPRPYPGVIEKGKISHPCHDLSFTWELSQDLIRSAVVTQPRIEAVERSCSQAYELVTGLKLITMASDQEVSVIEIPIRLLAPWGDTPDYSQPTSASAQMISLATVFLKTGAKPDEAVKDPLYWLRLS